MAKVKLVPTPRPPPEIHLILSKYEAESLRAICQHVGGDPAKQRGAIDKIDKALADVVSLPQYQISGTLYFKP